MRVTSVQGQSMASISIIQQAFSWMFGGLMLTAVTALAAGSSAPFQQLLAGNPIIFLLMIFGELGLVFLISARVNTLAHPTAILLFLVYAGLNGLTMSSIFLVYTGASITAAFTSASLIFGVMAGYGFVTKKDLSGLGSIAMMGLIGLIIASVVNIFLRSNALSFAFSYIAILIFTVLTAWDTQKLKMLSETMDGRNNLGIYGALTLYLDFINIFFALLRIFGNQRD